MTERDERKIFLSHAESDKELARKIEQLLKDVSHGAIHVWRSSSIDAIPAGVHVWAKIHEELGGSGKIIVVLTPVSCARAWLLWEAGYVAGLGQRKVIPLLCGVDRADIPDPLRVFKCCSATDPREIEGLLIQLLRDLGFSPSGEIVQTCVGPFCEEVRAYVGSLVADLTTKRDLSRASPDGPGEVVLESRDQFTNRLIEHLHDVNVQTIQLITYTSEVDGAFLKRFIVKGTKSIEVFKRSILADLAEQQECNLRRLREGVSVRRWDKRQTSIDASESLGRNAPVGSKITQYLYESPPAKRAYVFDDHEAIVAYYETINDPLETGGSVYKGITDLPALWVTRESKLGRFVLDELASHMSAIKRRSRTWEEERRILLDRAPWHGAGKRPCVQPRAVFLDLDGVLYNSLPDYVEAWQAAFHSIGVDFPEDEVYRQEGRRGRATIIDFLRKTEWNEEDITDELVDSVYAVKAKKLDARGDPSVQSGARELVKAIADTGLDMWVVTGSSRSATAERIESDFKGRIDRERIITGKDVRAGKPDPDPYLLACSMAKVHPHESVVIENAPLGIESADRAGTFCIAVNTGRLEDVELEKPGARVVFESCGRLAKLWPQVVQILRD